MATNSPSSDEVIGRLLSSFDALDQQRANGLSEIQILHTVRNAAAVREKQRLIRKYGADDPRVAKVEARIAFNERLATNLDAEIERTSVTPPEYDLDTWMVQGRVVDATGTAQPGLTLSLAQADGTWLGALGHTCSDTKGYYALRYKASAGTTPPVPETEPLFVTVTDTQDRVLHRDDRALYLEIGQIDVRPIVLDGSAGACKPPQPDGSSEGEGEDGAGGELPADAWIVRGNVVYGDGAPGAGLTVSLYDKDLIFDDRLGTTQTDAAGNFRIIYRTEAFRDLFERRPDLYLKVLDAGGHCLYSSRKAVRGEAGRVEEFRIPLEGAAQGSGKA